MRIVITFLFLCLANSCKKTESPCKIEDKNTRILLSIKSDSSFHPPIGAIYSLDSLKILYQNLPYPWTVDSYCIKLNLPPEEEQKDTLFLHWNIQDVDTVVLYYKLSWDAEDPCKDFEYCQAWFNGTFYPNRHPDTFYFTKK